ncbi:hypothetical protein [Rhizobium leguminosarum]|uniref:hypothetical protein n=1 Tax=Rhizobium leguminosarum TaxID=384 RepID=UPI0032AED12A
MSLDHESGLRSTFENAHRAKAHANMPFGALMAGPGGEILLEEESGYFPDLATAHAERLLATRASKLYREPFLAACTVYSSAEPVPCAPAPSNASVSAGSSVAFPRIGPRPCQGSPGQPDNGSAIARKASRSSAP